MVRFWCSTKLVLNPAESPVKHATDTRHAKLVLYVALIALYATLYGETVPAIERLAWQSTRFRSA